MTEDREGTAASGHRGDDLHIAGGTHTDLKVISRLNGPENS